MRTYLANWLADHALQHDEFRVLSGDHGYALFDPIRRHAPHHFLNVGVMEQAMVGIAAGLARTGFRPWVYGLSAFIPIRVLEQIKLDVCYPQLPVVFIGDGAGLVYSTLGASHQCGEDLACLRTLPITIISPADTSELTPALEFAAHASTPCYIRLGKCDRDSLQDIPRKNLSPYFTHSPKNRTAIVLVSHGSMASISRDIASQLNIFSYTIPLLHPFPEKTIHDLVGFDTIIFVDEHSTHGGLASAYIETCISHRCKLNSNIQVLGLTNQFSQRCGTYQYALSEHGLSDDQLRKSVAEMVTQSNND